jgi:chromatin remodeling complex protein RSC6
MILADVRYKLSEEFADILQIREDTRPGIVMALWQYIKVSLTSYSF